MCDFSPSERKSVAVRRPPPTLNQAPPSKLGGGLWTATGLAREGSNDLRCKW